jgi:hypothetical protein
MNNLSEQLVPWTEPKSIKALRNTPFDIENPIQLAINIVFLFDFLVNFW